MGEGSNQRGVSHSAGQHMVFTHTTESPVNKERATDRKGMHSITYLRHQNKMYLLMFLWCLKNPNQAIAYIEYLFCCQDSFVYAGWSSNKIH